MTPAVTPVDYMLQIANRMQQKKRSKHQQKCGENAEVIKLFWTVRTPATITRILLRMQFLFTLQSLHKPLANHTRCKCGRYHLRYGNTKLLSHM